MNIINALYVAIVQHLKRIMFFFGTSNRKLSDKHGLTVPLCAYCHRGPKGVHHKNKQLDLYIKDYAQMNLKKNILEFMKVFRKNYR